MKLFCYLPGCAKIETEPVRRAYVWAMVPLLGIILLGLESGLQVSTTTQIFGSFYSAFITLLPHGLIEIPSLALAGAVTYSANLLIRDSAMNPRPHPIFQQLETYRTKIPIKTIACLVIGALLLAGLIEAHVTPLMMQGLRP